MTTLTTLTLDDKIRDLKVNLDNCPDEELVNKLHKVCQEKYKKSDKKVFDKNDYKYKGLLKLLNKILEINNKHLIEDIYDFKNISRDEILKSEEANKLFGLSDELFKKKIGFNKTKCQWYLRNTNATYILSFIRGACVELGVEVVNTNKKKIENGMILYISFYSIV